MVSLIAGRGLRRGIAVAVALAALVPGATVLQMRPAFGKGLAAAASSISPVVALAGYQVSVFARGTTAYVHPDSLVSDGTHVFVGFQNVTAKDGSDHKSSTIVEYTMQGQVVRTFSDLGHNDGLRINPVTHMLWALSDEDGNPHLVTMDPVTGMTQLYAFPSAPHGGGYDDLAFTNGVALIDASNPTLDKNGVNIYPALDKVTLSNGKVNLTPLLMGNASALDSATQKKISLNLVDPDSMTFDPRGNLVLDNQGGSALVFIAGVGTPQQSMTQLSIGNQVDDTVWATSAAGRLLIADTAANTIYAVRAAFAPGTVYAAAPNDSGVASFVGTLNLKTGTVVPVIIGLSSPHGLAFIANSPAS